MRDPYLAGQESGCDSTMTPTVTIGHNILKINLLIKGSVLQEHSKRNHGGPVHQWQHQSHVIPEGLFQCRKTGNPGADQQLVACNIFVWKLESGSFRQSFCSISKPDRLEKGIVQPQNCGCQNLMSTIKIYFDPYLLFITVCIYNRPY